MANEIFFALREFCEVYALKTIVEYCRNIGLEFHWNALAFPVNTDFKYCNLANAFAGVDDVSVVESFDEAFLSQIRLFGFATDMHHDLDKYMQQQFSCSEIASCKLYPRHFGSHGDQKVLVIGNVKVKSPVEDFQLEIFQKLAVLPYEVVVVPRHPLSLEEMEVAKIPSSIKFVNTMGDLEKLHAMANLVIMGRIFSAGGLIPDDDHNPLEATINSHALCGVIKEVPAVYRWLYEESGLIHQCTTIDEVYDGIEHWMKDGKLTNKLARKEEWVRSNRNQLLGKIAKTLQL